MARYHVAGEDEQMTLTPYMVFVENNTQTLLTNVTFTANEWMKLVSDINQAQYDAMVIGLIMGFTICAIGILVGTWWKNRGIS